MVRFGDDVAVDFSAGIDAVFFMECVPFVDSCGSTSGEESKHISCAVVVIMVVVVVMIVVVIIVMIIVVMIVVVVVVMIIVVVTICLKDHKGRVTIHGYIEWLMCCGDSRCIVC